MKKRRKERKINPVKLSAIIVIICVILLTSGFSALQAFLDISDISAAIRIQKDIRVTGVSTANSVSSAYSSWEEYDYKNFSTSLALPNSDSTMTYDVVITNIGNVPMGILDITGLPSNLTYSISNYTLKDTLCDDNNSSKCKLGSVTTLHITIGYAANGYNSNNVTYMIEMGFDFRQVYSITYVDFANVSGLPSTILGGDTKNITFNSNSGVPAAVAVTNATGSYANPTLTLSNATDNVVITRKYSVTYIDFTGNTSGLISVIGSEGGTIAFNSTTGEPDAVVVTGARSRYDPTNRVLTLTNVTSDVSITMSVDGVVEIKSITLYDVSNVTENNSPQVTSNGQSVTFDLGVTVDANNYDEDFYITYAIVVDNDSVYEQKVLATNFTPNIVGTGNVPNVTYDITDANGNQVLYSTIPAKTSETYYLTITIVPQEEGSWGVEGESGVDAVENGTVTGSISGTTQGNLTGTNTTTHFVAEVSNSYDEAKSFTFSIDDNKFAIVNSNEVALPSMTIAANTTAMYDFYIKNLNGNSFMTSPYDLNINVNCDDDTSSIGIVSLLVDVDPTLTDHTAPVISNVSATITGTEKEILVSWTGSDDNTITNYYVETYTSNASGNGTLYHTETLNGGPNGVQATYTATVPNDNAYYYFKVYAKDQSDNIATSSEISSCSTSSGHCSRTNNERFKWNFVVTLTLENATSSNGTTTTSGSTRTVTFNVFYDGNINTTLSGASNYDPPSSIGSATITYANGSSETLPSGSSSQTAYAYNTSSHVLNVYHIKGDVSISADGVSSGTCLAEGTKILMADGTYKNVENIGYDDLLTVWNYDTGKVTYEYPLWIENEHIANEITRVTFADKSYIDFIGNHAVYSTDKNLFVNILDIENFKVGTHVAKLENDKLVSTTVTKIEKINKRVKYYFVGSTTYYNIFANNILTTDKNLMISNFYGFTENAKWPSEKKQILKDKDNLLDYSYFEDVLPYYLYDGFRVREAGYLINIGATNLDMFKTYITQLIVNPMMIRTPITIDNNRYWMVTTSEDTVNDINKNNFLKEEGSIYILPKSDNRNFKGWYNTSDNNIYKPGDKIKVTHGIHFRAIYEKNYFEFKKDLLYSW